MHFKIVFNLVLRSSSSVADNELETIVSEVNKQMLEEISTSEIKAEKDRIAEEKHRMEEIRYVKDTSS